MQPENQLNTDPNHTYPLWIVSKNQGGRSRLTELADGKVKFIHDNHHEYFAKTEKDKLWRVEGTNGFYQIVNFSSGNSLYVKHDQHKSLKLGCSKFTKDNERKYFWNFQLGSQDRSFVIQSVQTDQNGNKFYLCPPQNETNLRRNIFILPNRFQGEEAVLRSLQPSSTVKIPHFKGKVVDKNHSQYHLSISQYASSSYKSHNMSPHLVCYPLDVEDVKIAIAYAQGIKKNVIGRSGGHQYSGKSSGGDDTIVISMNSTHFQILQKRTQNQNLVDVGPGVTNRALNNQLTKWGFSVPHGQCPFVCIGGHAQTGGYGHFSRSFGLNGDYVEAFQIVLSNGDVHQVIRPNSTYLTRSKEISEELNNKIFTGVLTGNAGSFGIITRYTYKFIRDTDHPNSYSYTLVRSYNKGVFKSLLQECRNWTILISKREDQEKLRGLNMAISLASTKLPPWVDENFRFPILLVQLLYADLDKVPYNDQFKTIIQKSQVQLTFTDKILNTFMGGHSKLTKLSEAAHAFVRKWPFVTFDGREYSLPYKKRVNVTLEALTQEFIQRTSDLVERVLTENKVKLIFQIGIGGGQLRRKGEQINSQGFITYPHRNSTFCFSFDLFYDPKSNEQQRAIEFHNEMGKIVDECYSGDQERRRFWGSFGSTDMSDPKIVLMYYNDMAHYETLQRLKAQLDPNDTFHTEFTVQLPKNNS